MKHTNDDFVPKQHANRIDNYLFKLPLFMVFFSEYEPGPVALSTLATRVRDFPLQSHMRHTVKRKSFIACEHHITAVSIMTIRTSRESNVYISLLL